MRTDKELEEDFAEGALTGLEKIGCPLFIAEQRVEKMVRRRRQLRKHEEYNSKQDWYRKQRKRWEALDGEN